MRLIPKALIFARLLIGILILIFSFLHVDNYKTITIILFTIGLLTDIFDGIIARQLKISTQNLRRLDSTVDQIFFVLIAVATFIESPIFFYNNKIELILLLSNAYTNYFNRKLHNIISVLLLYWINNKVGNNRNNIATAKLDE